MGEDCGAGIGALTIDLFGTEMAPRSWKETTRRGDLAPQGGPDMHKGYQAGPTITAPHYHTTLVPGLDRCLAGGSILSTRSLGGGDNHLAKGDNHGGGSLKLLTRSQFATATWRPACVVRWSPTWSTAAKSMKLCVEPEFSRAGRCAVLMMTTTWIVHPDQGWIPVSACSEIVGASSSSSSSRSSMVNNFLLTSRWPDTKCSSHLKQRPFAWRSVISAWENFLLAED
jgi:hypothetical protein